MTTKEPPGFEAGSLAFVAEPTTAEIRAAIVAFCHWGIANEPTIHYAQQRPMERLRAPAELQQLPRWCDCSEFATDAYYAAGAPDPNGQGYNGTGFTGTLLLHGRRIGIDDAQPGDLAVFGPAPGHHVVVLLEHGSANSGDPVVCSHGSERGPVALRLSQEQQGQPRPVTFLSYLP
jgi:cell wall-associated NlpC family hydrolase